VPFYFTLIFKGVSANILKYYYFKSKDNLMLKKDKSPKLTAKFIETRKAELTKRRQEILRELKADTVQVADNDYNAKFVDYGDKDDENAAEVATFEKNLSLEKTLEVSLYNVNKAIKKIDEGNYGLCEKCDKPITPERLEAFPSATSCMDCKKKSL
jgi:DnaK suppressor protein